MSYVTVNNDQCHSHKDNFRNACRSQGYFDPPSASAFTVVTLKQDFGRFGFLIDNRYGIAV